MGGRELGIQREVTHQVLSRKDIYFIIIPIINALPGKYLERLFQRHFLERSFSTTFISSYRLFNMRRLLPLYILESTGRETEQSPRIRFYGESLKELGLQLH